MTLSAPESLPPKPVVLVVDDAPESIDVLRGVLGGDYQLKAAINGPTALEVAEYTQPDLILLDVMMPEMDGYEATLEIRKQPRWRKLPIIAVTAKAMKDDQERCLQAGANDYLAKPIDLDRLFSLIRVWLPKMERI